MRKYGSKPSNHVMYVPRSLHGMRTKSNCCSVVKVTGLFILIYQPDSMSKLPSINEIIIDLIKSYSCNRNFYFRGMRDASWHLENSFYRFTKEDNKVTSNPKHVHADTLLTNFKSNLYSQNFLPHQVISSMEDEELWQYGQHYGLPTLLLDWTSSPFLALFFALNETSKDESNPSKKKFTGAIWVLNEQVLSMKNQSLPTEKRLEIVYPIVGINQRIIRQKGIFTYSKHCWEHDSLLENMVSNETIKPPLFEKLQFEYSEKERQEALILLDEMNINYSTVYPDIEGCAKDAKQALVNILNTRSGDSINIIRDA